MANYKKEKKLAETTSEEAQTLHLLGKDFKGTVLNKFKQLKENTHTQTKGNQEIIYEQSENTYREIEL